MSDLTALYDRLREAGLAAGLSEVGVTSADVLEPARSVLARRRETGLAGTMQFTYRNPDRSTDPGWILSGARSMVVGVLGYRRADVAGERPGAGRVARYARSDHYERLREGLEAVAEVLAADGHQTRVVADSNALVDRNAAWRAGLGWYGKNTNLLIGGSGSWYVLGAVVTDAALEASAHPVADGCGSCSACIDGCPTDAIVAPGVLDARRCIAWLVQAAEPIPVEFREAVGDRIYGCDICQEVCPPNRVEDRRSELQPEDPASDTWIDTTWLLTASDHELLDRCGRWYIADRNPDVIRRTALVVLGNAGPLPESEVRPLLQRYVEHGNPLLRAHAVWAARRLGFDDLAETVADDPDPLVRAELEHRVTPVVAALAGSGG